MHACIVSPNVGMTRSVEIFFQSPMSGGRARACARKVASVHARFNFFSRDLVSIMIGSVEKIELKNQGAMQ